MDETHNFVGATLSPVVMRVSYSNATYAVMLIGAAALLGTAL